MVCVWGGGRRGGDLKRNDQPLIVIFVHLNLVRKSSDIVSEVTISISN